MFVCLSVVNYHKKFIYVGQSLFAFPYTFDLQYREFFNCSPKKWEFFKSKTTFDLVKLESLFINLAKYATF